MTIQQPLILTEVRNRTGHLTINRPGAYNAINLDTVRLLLQQLRQWADDPAILAVVLRGSGDKAFCAGGDIRELYDNHLADSPRKMAFFEEQYVLDQYIHDYPKPLIAVSNGLVLGGGMGLFQGAAHRVIGPAARLGMPEVGIGYFPDVGGSWFLSRLPSRLGNYLAITGNILEAADALYTGLADWLLDENGLLTLEHQLDSMAWHDNPRGQVDTLLASLAQPIPAGTGLEQQRERLEQHFAHASVAAIMASLASDPHEWAIHTLATLESRSPMAMLTALELQQRAAGQSLPYCLAMELHVIRQWFDQGDFIEGVRALIVDKDKNPRWKYASVDQVPAQAIASLLACFTEPA